uniref:SFRICE_040260 n=1 Tax=Spodoptera frugiperda TaxID=7108 RepID=A0A2H1WH06_SPOFR
MSSITQHTTRRLSHCYMHGLKLVEFLVKTIHSVYMILRWNGATAYANLNMHESNSHTVWRSLI